MFTPVLQDGRITVRAIRVRDWRAIQDILVADREWLRHWEATNPDGTPGGDLRSSIRALIAQARAGIGLAFVVEDEGELVGQLNVSNISYGALSSCSIGYWIRQASAGRGITPTAVALVTDYLFQQVGLHRVEICIRPENHPSLRIVQKLGFRYEGRRKRYIHIDGDWRDHLCFALVAEEVHPGVLARWRDGSVDPTAAHVPPQDLA